MSEKRIKNFEEFWPFYLEEHSNPTSRRLHFIGTTGVLLLLFGAILTSNWWLLLAMPVCGYSFAWTGHFFFQKNRPATFKYPFWSLLADFKLYFAMLFRRI